MLKGKIQAFRISRIMLILEKNNYFTIKKNLNMFCSLTFTIEMLEHYFNYFYNG